MDYTSLDSPKKIMADNSYDWKNNLKCRISKTDVIYYAQALHNDEHGISSLYNALLTSGDERVSYNAAWILSHLSKADKEMYLTAYYDSLVNLSMSPELSIRRGLILSILVDMSVGDSPRTDLLDYCLNGMLDKKESDSTRSVMIKLSARMCKPYPELKNELMANLEFLSQDMKPSISSASRNAMKYLK